MEPLQEKDKNSEHGTTKNEIDIEREDIQEKDRRGVAPRVQISLRQAHGALASA